MFSLPSLSLSTPWFLNKGSRKAIEIGHVDIHDIEASEERRARTLKYILKLNHANYSILYHNLQFHNHMPHLLGSAYLLGSNERSLESIYDEESEYLEKWKSSPEEVTPIDWREHLGDRHYQRAYVDFFEDELVSNGYEWRKVVEKYLYEGSKPLINSLVSGLGHPLIHLGYAYELSSREVAMEALGLSATCYDYMHKYLDDKELSKTPNFSSASLKEILQRIASDKRLDGLFPDKGGNNLGDLFKNYEQIVLEYWNAWNLKNPTEQFRDSQIVSILLLAGTQSLGTPLYDFFIVHALTTSHAIRVLLPFTPSDYQIPLVRQWWLLTLAVYISQLRPTLDDRLITDYEIKGKNWTFATHEAIGGKWSHDAHFVKAIRAIKDAEATWGQRNGFFIKAAVKLCEQFNGWSGFGDQSIS